ncbi:Dabb family protein [Rickettsiella endosymbiont of Dermanyssus gallinae]|uniref:Dabb family protein n=1 Tax=Rickettsiella endosymbiont of Dermanyssus gallinae TaxID=2856608 RepID=UPI001C52D1AC|nr:Dabb family protein [Rickettsiella endosymbiont of Dermanyssus gallinae]
MIDFFSFREISEATPYFNEFTASINNRFSYKFEYGVYESKENRNKGYNYVLKINSDENLEEIDDLFKKEYKLFIEKIMPSLNKEEPMFSLVFKPSHPPINKGNLQEKPQINHIVFLPFKKDCSDEAIKEVFYKLKELFSNVEGASSFCYGKRLNSSVLDREYVFEMHFLSATARDKYLVQDQHIKVAEFIIPLLENEEASIIAFDYRLPKSCEKQTYSMGIGEFFNPEVRREIAELNKQPPLQANFSK